jgi:hypothetical protein
VIKKAGESFPGPSDVVIRFHFPPPGGAHLLANFGLIEQRVKRARKLGGVRLLDQEPTA